LEWRLGDSWGISDRGTKAKSITFCDNGFVTNTGAVAVAVATLSRKKHLLARDPAAKRMLSVRKRSGSDKSAQSERKSTTRYEISQFFYNRTKSFI